MYGSFFFVTEFARINNINNRRTYFFFNCRNWVAFFPTLWFSLLFNNLFLIIPKNCSNAFNVCIFIIFFKQFIKDIKHQNLHFVDIFVSIRDNHSVFDIIWRGSTKDIIKWSISIVSRFSSFNLCTQSINNRLSHFKQKRIVRVLYFINTIKKTLPLIRYTIAHYASPIGFMFFVI